ncbi:MAG: hypothetical protein HYY63_01440, partial [Elusimicrobia bacterium]|nr:hypothetical protein [Elusimicrobiota bacterium]
MNVERDFIISGGTLTFTGGQIVHDGAVNSSMDVRSGHKLPDIYLLKDFSNLRVTPVRNIEIQDSLILSIGTLDISTKVLTIGGSITGNINYTMNGDLITTGSTVTFVNSGVDGRIYGSNENRVFNVMRIENSGSSSNEISFDKNTTANILYLSQGSRLDLAHQA